MAGCESVSKEKGQKLMPIFDPIKPPHFSILIMACASVEVSEGDGLPPFICQRCIAKLNVAFQFKSQCESSDARLRQCLQNLHTLPPATELTALVEVEKAQSDNINLRNNIKIDVCDLNSGQIQEYTLQDDTAQLTGDKFLTNPNLSNINEADIQQSAQSDVGLESLHETLEDITRNNLRELKFDFQEYKDDSSYVKIEEIGRLNVVDVAVQQQIVNNKNQKPVKEHQCDTCGKIFRTKPGLIHHIRIHTGERPYVCHLCDKRFINGGHLHTHMRTHTGEKNHICAACNKAFATAQQLTKHTIAIHTSERPYACTYCSKRFASSSNLNTHTRIHTGEKNYHCDQCTKAFSTKGQLYQHLLVHTGEKAFLCEYCNKRFSQKAHLIRHLKMHNVPR
ncbi:zinc finger protein 664-like isoform X2 [Agrilus planipennis]|uniref:Zinc finger protein unc-98 n=1 Tax=Agrilus planipennis TaxID=224129 RepID=A0A1W4X8W4_AGRPL|nr:zinc finger protein 664-like isoform X2 [Agrilus planipennis]